VPKTGAEFVDFLTTKWRIFGRFWGKKRRPKLVQYFWKVVASSMARTPFHHDC